MLLRGRPGPIKRNPFVILSRTTLIVIIIVIAAIAAASLGGLFYQRNKAGTVEIRLDKDGIRIEGN